MLCTALGVLYILAQRSFLVWLEFAEVWDLLGFLIGTIVTGILDMCQRHQATGGNLGIGDLAGNRYCMCVLVRVG